MRSIHRNHNGHALPIFNSNGVHKKTRTLLRMRVEHLGTTPQRLENWNRLRAPGWPDFLRSFIRESRVSRPLALSTGR